MKKFILIFSFYLLCQKVEGQVFKVGDINCNHTVINHTFTTACSFSVNGASQTFTFDVDGDLVSDIQILSSCQAGSSNYCSSVLNVTSSTGFEFVKDNTTSNPVVKNLAFATAINSNSNWMTFGYLYVNNCTFTMPFTWGQLINPFYVGFRKVLTNDTIYGWIKTSSIWPGQIFSIAYKNVSDTSSAPSPVITNTNTSICFGDSITLTGNPAGGYFYGPGVIGNKFYSSSAGGPGTYKIVYNLNPTPSTILCNGTASISITVNAPPTATFTSLPYNVCNNSTFTLTGSPAGGVFSGTGVSGSIFNSSMTGPGTFSLSYIYTDVNGCSKTANSSINVIPNNTISAVTNHSIICSGDTAIISLNGGNGYTITTSTSASTMAVSGPTVLIVTPNITTTYSITTECASPIYLTQNVSSCVGINELVEQENYLKIFPNPNNGEFEIKSDNKNVIVITNELGQQIKTVELNSENNFSSKITNLPSGVYFIGNNYSQQKIVVIK